jgi:hypothetical protein
MTLPFGLAAGALLFQAAVLFLGFALLLELSRRLRLRAAPGFLLLTPPLRLVADALFLFGDRRADVRERRFDQRMTGPVAFEQRHSRVSITIG